MKVTFKPCPFCGSEAPQEDEDDNKSPVFTWAGIFRLGKIGEWNAQIATVMVLLRFTRSRVYRFGANQCERGLAVG
jgi:hypothetical protein